jgi:dicarboxylate transporter 10
MTLVKVRLQTRAPGAPKTMLGTFTSILRIQGIFGLYNGLSAALLRQLTYSTVRFGVYEDLKQRFSPQPTPTNPNPKLSFGALILMSSFSGFCGGVIGNPGDVLNVRMQSDFAKPEDERRSYKHALDGLIRMVREEGVASLFRGVGANSARALLMTSSQLASYDAFKRVCLDSLHLDDNLVTHFTSSLAAGFVATTICSPVDVVKTRVMSAGGKVPIIQLLKDATRNEGYLWMLRGWVPSFIRLGPQTVVTMLFLEQHRKYYRKWKGLD